MVVLLMLMMVLLMLMLHLVLLLGYHAIVKLTLLSRSLGAAAWRKSIVTLAALAATVLFITRRGR